MDFSKVIKDYEELKNKCHKILLKRYAEKIGNWEFINIESIAIPDYDDKWALELKDVVGEFIYVVFSTATFNELNNYASIKELEEIKWLND